MWPGVAAVARTMKSIIEIAVRAVRRRAQAMTLFIKNRDLNMMVKLSLLVFVSMLTASCASIEPEPLIGPNGNQAYAMRCSGMGRTLEMCYQKAGEICPAGYRIVGQASAVVAVPVNGSVMAAPQHNLTIECK